MEPRLFSPSYLFGLIAGFAVCICCVQCQSATDEVSTNTEVIEPDTTHFPTFFRDRASILNGRVKIRLEPHGSVRAEVFRDQEAQYEFILDREKQQHLLTRNIDRANIYIDSRLGLVIDDLAARKRYVLTPSGAVRCNPLKMKRLQKTNYQVVHVNGYGSTLMSNGHTGLDQ
ncbi:hypothetical protein [Spirosoma sp.]|uniref:hypothetical protein n=1 Tax=Spirosoma sp. TaxID=1899569 RepID=UPI003B3A1F1D